MLSELIQEPALGLCKYIKTLLNFKNIMYPEKVDVYLKKVLNALNEDLVFQKDLFIEYGIEDFKLLLESLEYELTIESLENFNISKDPLLSITQIERCLNTAIAQYYINNLKEKGLVESVFSDGQIKYRVTEKN